MPCYRLRETVTEMRREHTFLAFEPCLRAPDCKNGAEIRGNCRSCYNAFKVAVMRGETTEERAIAEGKILPPYGGKTARSWFSKIS